MKQRCAKCKEEKELDKFYANKTGPNGRQRHCIVCKKQFDREHFQRYPERRLARNKAHYNKNTDHIIECKSTGCVKCGESRHYLLDFHHTDPSNKSENVSALKASALKLKEELEKCIILCANCHREFHHFQKVNRITINDYINCLVV